MFDVEESIENSLKSLKEYGESNKAIKSFVKDLELYNSELDTVNYSINIINEDLKSYDIIDYLYSKLNYNLLSLGVVNKLIQQVKVCKNEIQDLEYLNKAEKVFSFLIQEGYKFIDGILKKSVDLLYMNDDFIIFANLMESDRQIKQMILWQRSQECHRKRSYYKGDLNVFYRMMIKQECFIWAKLFYMDFSKTLSNLFNGNGFTLYEKFLYSIFLPLFENGDVIITLKEKINFSVEDFYNSVKTQDHVYDLLLDKCYSEFSGDNEMKKNVMEI